MNFPPTTTRAFPADEGTREYQPAGLPSEPPERLRVAVAGPSGDRSGEGQPEQLRRRLRVLAAMQGLGFSGYLLLLATWSAREFLSGEDALQLAGSTRERVLAALTCAGCEFGCYFSLSGRRPLSLVRLRVAEVLVILPYAAFFFYTQLLSPKLYPDAIRAADPLILAQGEVLPWVILLIAYGVLIPNVWRRCAAAVAALAAVALLSHVTAYALSAMPFPVFAAMFALKALYLAVATGIVVYGSYRVQVLHERELRARELGQYRLGRRLGGGGMGEVYLAEHRLLRRPAALKLIRPDRAGDPAHLARFEREVQATAALTHPNTVQIFDYGRADDGTFYYVMEYLPGLTLEELVRRHGPLVPARAVYFLRQICGALGEAHAAGLVHRDLKPGNMMVGERGGIQDTVKLLDFGLVLPPAANRDEKLTQHGHMAGTPAFVSPEQAAGQDAVDRRSDIYSLGASAYYLLTGRPPFAGPGAVKVLAAHLYEEPEPPGRHHPGIPASLDAVVLRCLAKDPAGRFADAAALDAALAACGGVGDWTGREAAEWWRRQTAPPGG